MRRTLYLILLFLIGTLAFPASYKGEKIAPDKRITVDFRDMELLDVVRIISRNFEINLIAGDSVKGKVTVSFTDVPLDDALELILKVNGYTYVKDSSIIRVLSLEDAKKFYADNVEVAKEVASSKYYMVYEVKYGDVQKIGDNLKKTLKSDDKVIVDENINKIMLFIDSEEKSIVENMLKDMDVQGIVGIKKVLPPVSKGEKRTVILPVKNELAETLVSVIKDIYQDFSGELKPNTAIKSIIVTGTLEEIENVEKILEKLDLPPLQVSIEAKIVEISGSNARALGMDWNYGISGDDTGGKDSLDTGITNTDITKQIGDGFRIKYGVLEGPKFDIAFRALLNNTDTNLLSNPNITTLSGKAAVINVGDKIPYPVAAKQGDPVTYQFESVGIKLEVTPNVLEDGNINLVVKPEVSNQNGSTPDSRPIVSSRDANTNVIIKNGETLVIGGLMRTDEVKVVSSIPLLGDIPFLGELFKSHNTTKKKTNLIFFITPKIINIRDFKSKIEFNFKRESLASESAKGGEAK